MAEDDLARRREQLSPASRAELMQRLRGGAAPGRTIPQLAAGTPAPLSTSQERLWLIDQLVPGTAAYNVPVALRIRGALDSAALKRALDELVRRHAILRTVFEPAPEGCRQRVLPGLAVALPIFDLCMLDAGARAATETAHVRAVCEQPFDLARGPLLRARLLWIQPREHLLLLGFHHIVCDGASAAIAVRELTALYQAFVTGRPSPLPALAIQYADYAAWQRGEGQGAALAAGLERWQAALADAPPWLELATDRPRDAAPALDAATEAIVVPADVVARVRAIGRAEGATPFMVLLAALQAVLVRHTGQREVVVGTPISTRARPELEGLIGFFVNTLPLRARVAPGDSFRTLLRAVRDTTLAAFAGREVPFEQILERLGLRAEAGRVPLGEVMFSYEEPVAAPAGGELGLALDWEELDTGSVHLELVVRVRPVADGLRVLASYRRRLFAPERIARLLGHYRNLLGAIADAPDAPVGELAMLGADERRLLGAWAAPARTGDAPGCVHELVEAAVDRAPDACALIHEDRRLSYAELDARANQLAHALVAAGVAGAAGLGPEPIVGVALRRSERLVIALLAIWKAGGVYLPLDPDDPRLARLVRDAGAALVIADEAIAALDGLATAELRFDRDGDAIARQPRHRPARPAAPRSLAYLVYTSGSTGEAKGVLVEHASLCNQARWKVRACELGAADRLLHCIPHTFDPAIWDVVGPLIAGAAIVLTPPGAHREPAQLTALIARHRVTVLDLALPMLQALLAAPGLAGVTTVRHVFCGGDAMPPDVPARVHRALGARLCNQYGPAEATIDALSWRCDPAVTEPVPIGRPIDNVQVYLLDDALQLLPAGAAGEICIGGAGVARGYLGEDARHAGRFVADPFQPGRLYRTGDLGRHRGDGALEFLGRRDQQVKIRGVRVEPGEIEARLLGHGDVREAVVLARGDGADRVLRLVAYVVPRADRAPSPRELRAYLRSQLPEAMVPSGFAILPALPLGGNGKLDRNALLRLELAPAARDAEYVAPRTEAERRVAAIMSECLGVERVGALDQFLELGGHSLAAMRVAARLSEATGAAVPVRLVLEQATVAALAAAVDGLPAGARRGIVARAAGTPVPLSHQQRFIWRLARTPEGAIGCNVPLSVRFTGALDTGALAWAIERLIARHDSLRTTFAGDGDDLVQQVQPAAALVLRRIELEDAVDGEAWLADLALAEARVPFDLRRDLLVRGALVGLAPHEHALLLTTHRIAYDGWSLRVLARELMALYVARTRGVASMLPELAVQYADYAAWQQAGDADAEREREREERYWLAQLGDAPASAPAPPLALALTSPTAGARHVRALSPALTTAVSAYAAAEAATPFMVVLAAVQLALSSTGRGLDEPLCVPVANRGSRDLEPLIGRFVNMVALRPRIAAADSAREALGRVREALVGALAHQQFPYERLVAACAARGLALPSVLCNFVDAPIGRLELPGLQVEPLPALEPTAEFPLSITAHAAAGVLTLSAVFATEAVGEGAAALLLARIERVLGGLIAGADRTVGALVHRIVAESSLPFLAEAST